METLCLQIICLKYKIIIPERHCFYKDYKTCFIAWEIIKKFFLNIEDGVYFFRM